MRMTPTVDCGLRIEDCGLADGKTESEIRNPKSEIAKRGFTLVELLVVITIIGILASLITVAAVGALKSASRTRIKLEINQIAGGFEESKNKTTTFPPNCQTDDAKLTGGSNPLQEQTVFNDLKYYMKKAFPRSQESDDLIYALIGIKNGVVHKALEGGVSADEAVVFWLGGFSADPKYPISGEGGPAYPITAWASGTNSSPNRTSDPIESRKWIFPFDVSRLGPRHSDNFFDESVGTGRYLEYTDPKGAMKRINFWRYTPAKSDQAYMYFDTSRHAPGVVSGSNLIPTYDPPAATELSKLGPSNAGLFVYAFKKQNPSWSSTNTSVPGLVSINSDKFQVIHCGLPNTWDTDNYARMLASGSNTDLSKYLLFPEGPFIGDIGETIVSFAVETKIEDSQPQ